jgi:hypothetical protein
LTSPPPGHTWGICLFTILRRREFDLFSSGWWGICYGSREFEFFF